MACTLIFNNLICYAFIQSILSIIVSMSTEKNINELVTSLGQVKLDNAVINNDVDESTIQPTTINNVNDEKPPCKTGLIYDKRMADYKCTTVHPERPERITRIYQKLLDENLVDRCENIEPRFATKEEILLKHTEKHLDYYSSIPDKTLDELEAMIDNSESVYYHHNLPESALLSAGCTLEIVEQVLQGRITNGAAVVRPPGHHALEDKPMGFCHFNNVALAAMMAIEKYNLSRVLIVDWDVHYGNGTHQMYDEDPRVFYFSPHRFDNGMFWPNLEEANYDAVGKGPGEGYNMHVAWNRGKIKDSSYLFAFDNLLIPVVKDFDPELVLVSAGFDSGKGDPLGRCSVTPVGYAHMTKKLMQFAKGNMVIVLEGGYNLTTISNSMASCVATLLGDEVPPFEPSENEQPCQSSLKSITNTFFAHLPFWKNALAPRQLIFEDLKKSFELAEEEPKEDADDISSSSDEEDEDTPDYVKVPNSSSWTISGT